MTDNIFDFLIELADQLFHADLLITEQAECIEALEAENSRLESLVRKGAGA